MLSSKLKLKLTHSSWGHLIICDQTSHELVSHALCGVFSLEIAYKFCLTSFLVHTFYGFVCTPNFKVY